MLQEKTKPAYHCSAVQPRPDEFAPQLLVKSEPVHVSVTVGSTSTGCCTSPW
jgi:hypothetical protein